MQTTPTSFTATAFRPRCVSAIVASVGLLAVTAVASAQEAPSPRAGYAMAYDSVRDQVILFGGRGESLGDGLNDTWIWSDAGWRKVDTEVSPPPLRYACMAFDAKRGVAVLFGGWGEGNIAQSDTWEFDGQNWRLVDVGDKRPPARFLSAMTYDAGQGKVVLFGGRDVRRRFLDDLWVYDGAGWTEIPAKGPYARGGHAMTYNPTRGTVVVMGGFTTAALNDAWEFDGKMWTQLSTSRVPARHIFALAYDSDHDRLVLFGGAGRGAQLNDTWFWADGEWVRGPSAGPVPRAYFSGVYRPGHGFLIFGGVTGGQRGDQRVLNDMWRYDGQRWTPGWD